MIFEKLTDFEKYFPAFAFVVLVLGIPIFIFSGQHWHVPTFIMANIAVWFSFLAYKFSREKFRLDLLDRRWEVYEATLKFCSMVMTFGGIPNHSEDEDRNQEVIEGLIAAQKAFRSIGYHKSKALFGSDINDKFDQLNKAYAWFLTHRDIEYRNYSPENFEDEKRYMHLILDIANTLPDLFKPYVYFGDYRR